MMVIDRYTTKSAMPHIGMDRKSLYRLYKRYLSVEMLFFALCYIFEISGFWAKKDFF
jgi:hypothetical protein